jgi:hypothetical protein
MRFGLMAAFLLAFGDAAPAQAPRRLASQLQDGMRIEYAADGGPPSAWIVGTAIPVANTPAGSDCMRYVIQKGPEPGAADTLRQCVRGDTLFAIDRYGEWTAMRPVGPNMRLEIRRTNGSTLIETAAVAADTVSGVAIPVVITTYTIRGPNAQAIQQLRERFAVSMGTATRGTFYEADPAAPDGWKVQRTFRMSALRKP